MSEMRQKLMRELNAIQNNTSDVLDIVTITAFMNDEQLAEHVTSYRELSRLVKMLDELT